MYVHYKTAITVRLTQSNFNKPARPFVSRMQWAKRTRQWKMPKITTFFCLLSHVRRICGCLPAPVRESVTCSHYQYRSTEKLTEEKTLLQALLNFSCVPMWTQNLLILGRIQWEIIERWHTLFLTLVHVLLSHLFYHDLTGAQPL